MIKGTGIPETVHGFACTVVVIFISWNCECSVIIKNSVILKTYGIAIGIRKPVSNGDSASVNEVPIVDHLEAISGMTEGTIISIAAVEVQFPIVGKRSIVFKPDISDWLLQSVPRGGSAKI
ncbi:hypothetical protein [uncultured Parasutterella sp.]|uniref:hypothetical protein n=1 Tax=uncultured Parasutterella sp. TaxID=1263098 RepID=UPI002594666F|nr:hypothetical protein [uncultured Parasutterella sp.]